MGELLPEGGARPGPQLSKAAWEFLNLYKDAVVEMYVYGAPGSIPGLDLLQAEHVAHLEKLAARYGVNEQDLKIHRWAGKHQGDRLAEHATKVNTTPYVEPTPLQTVQPELI